MNTESLVSLLCELFVKSTLILTAAALLILAWRGASAAQRHLVWCAALTTVLLLPFTRLLEPRWSVPLQRVRVEMPRPEAKDLPPIENSLASEAIARPIAATSTWKLPDWKHALLLVWAAGASLLLALRLLGSARLVWLRKATSPLIDARVRQMAAEIFCDLRIRQAVDLRVSSAGSVPLTWGSLRPVLTLPAEALAWTDDQLAAALRHEAGHIARRDHFTRSLAQFACIAYWPNPLVWIAARRLRAAQEEATDDLVLRGGTAPEEYAAQLFEVARTLVSRRSFDESAVPMASPSNLERRMLAIVDERRDRRPLSLGAVLGGMLAVVVTLGLSTAAQLQAEEKKAAGERIPGPWKGPQIMIESKFVELTEEATTKLGLSFFDEATATEAAKGAMALAGVFTGAQFAKVIEGLQQQRGVDLLSAPRVTTHSEQRATIEIIREYRYPTEYEKDGQGWKPTAFETRNTGVTLEVLAVATADGKLDLELAPSVVDFLGFIDLDNGAKYPANSKPNASPAERIDATAGVPAGRRARPVFSERKINTTVTVWDGQTVVLGTVGKPRENKDFPSKSPTRRLSVFITAKVLGEQPGGPPAAPAPAPDPTQEIVIPRIEFRGATLSEAVAFLVVKSQAAGSATVNIVVPKLPEPEPMLSLSLTNVPLPEAVRYVASLAGLSVRQDANAFILESPSAAAPAGPAAEKPSIPEASEAPSAALQKARSIVIPRIAFKEATLAEALDFLRARATELDAEADPKKRGVNVILLDPPAAAATARITINLANVPLSEALRYVAGLTGLALAAEPNALVLRAPTKSSGAASGAPDANWVPGKPGFVTSPHAPEAGYIDVQGLKAGTEVKDPYSGKRFRVPEAR